MPDKNNKNKKNITTIQRPSTEVTPNRVAVWHDSLCSMA